MAVWASRGAQEPRRPKHSGYTWVPKAMQPAQPERQHKKQGRNGPRIQSKETQRVPEKTQAAPQDPPRKRTTHWTEKPESETHRHCPPTAEPAGTPVKQPESSSNGPDAKLSPACGSTAASQVAVPPVELPVSRSGKSSMCWCPSGHALLEFKAALPSICGACQQEADVGAAMWGCQPCDFELCLDCREALPQCDAGCAASTAHDGNLTDSTDTPRQAGEEGWATADDTWWSLEVDTWDWNACDDLEFQQTVDETLTGPDGDLYDIFYPGDSLPEDFTAPEDLSPRSASSSSSHSRPKTSGELGILSILTFMRSVAADRYPARAMLFDIVHTAASMALGDNFDRFALVGSTALRIDTPDSDLDAVVFTRNAVGPSGEEMQPPMPVIVLRQIADMLQACDPSLRLQLVDCTRVPVLTAFTEDGQISLDLTVDQPQSEWHVLWLQSQRREGVLDTPFMQGVPVPTLDGWEQGLEAAALRCIKWWLRRRHIPVSKEGGYPTVVWTLMVIHALRCSVFYDEAKGEDEQAAVDERTLLAALAVFFDRFSEGGLGGTLLFAEGKHARFCPQPHHRSTQLAALPSESFSVLDPTTTSEDSAAVGITPAELAPRISSATQLLHAYELHRAQQLSALALTCEESSASTGEGGAALRELFSDVGDKLNLIPAVVPEESLGVIYMRESTLSFGLLERIRAKPGWGAGFLHRHDKHSRVGVRRCYIEADQRLAIPQGFSHSHVDWLSPADIVCVASLQTWHEASSQTTVFQFDTESFERWYTMHKLLGIDFHSTRSMPPPKARKSRYGKKYGKDVVRI